MNSSLLSGVIFGPWGISKKPGDNKKEKLINSKNLKIKVKCNSALAETLVNKKRDEINSLENNYNSNIEFFSIISRYNLII